MFWTLSLWRGEKVSTEALKAGCLTIRTEIRNPTPKTALGHRWRSLKIYNLTFVFEAEVLGKTFLLKTHNISIHIESWKITLRYWVHIKICACNLSPRSFTLLKHSPRWVPSHAQRHVANAYHLIRNNFIGLLWWSAVSCVCAKTISYYDYPIVVEAVSRCFSIDTR